MSWIELIRVRSNDDCSDEIIHQLDNSIAKIADMKKVMMAGIFQHFEYNGDIAVIIHWDDGLEPCKSHVGVAFADYLSRFGPVEHAVWKFKKFVSVSVKRILNQTEEAV